MRLHGPQDDVVANEVQKVHERSMTATETLKAVKHANLAVKEDGSVCKHDGTLSNFNLGKLNKSLSTFAEAAREMEIQLITATTNSNIISPALVQRLAAVKCEIDAEAAGLALYKESNREEDTVQVVKRSMGKLNDAKNQFKVIAKMLKAMPPNPIPAEEECDTVPASFS